MRGAVLSLVICWSSAIALDAAAQQAPAPKPIPVAVKTTGATPKAVAPATQTAAAAPAKPVAKKSTKKPAANPAPQMVSDVAAWVTSSGDNRGLPFAIVDKNSAQVLIYDTKGKLRGRAPVLIGSAVGDQSAPGVGDRELKDIPMADRTTPAGRYLVGFGPAAGGEHVLWIDYNNAISMHAIPQTKQSVKEKRAQRLASKTSDDNRISHG
ncbi:MAG TPA: hypothetical protein VG942_10905, partial [Hyphomonadaceae bacterium]|nr:hypothetical protein [Hyphomonadaceae bacterium]